MHHLSVTMTLLSFTHLPFRNPILLRQSHRLDTAASHLSLSVSPSRATLFPRSNFLLLYRDESYWVEPACRKCRAGAGIGDMLHDAGATAIVLAGAYGLVLGFNTLTQRNFIRQSLSRKLVHILSGLLFMVSLPIFSMSTGARYFASLVPLVNCFRLIVHGLSWVSNEGLIKSVTREGNPEELLRGPLYYVLVLILCAVIFWRESPVGVISVSMMCAGDGIADIMGRKFGSMKIFYNQKKSWAGSISMFLFGFLASIGMLYYYSVLGYFQLDWAWTVQRVALISVIATVIESLPITEVLDDNISVPLATMVAAYFSFA